MPTERLRRLGRGLRAALGSRLARRQVRLVLVVALGVGWLLSALQIAVDYRAYRDSLTTQLDQLATTTLSTAAAAAWQLDGQLARVVCEGLTAHPAIDGCVLRLPGPLSLGETRVEPATTWLPLSDGLFGGRQRRELPLRHEGPQAIGRLALDLNPASAVNDFSRRVLTHLLTGTLRALVLALVLFAVFHALTLRPITRLSRLLADADPGAAGAELPRSARHRHDDEIRSLETATLGLMQTVSRQMADLKAAKQDLEHTNRHLEDRIRARTRELEQAMRAMRDRAYTDPLTGLANRRAFFEAAADYLARWERDGEAFAVVLADLDEFKTINDRLGHDLGDRALRAVADGWRRICRQDDCIARFGGEEFIGLFRVDDRDQAREVAERLRREVAALRLEGLPWSLTVSLGVALVGPGDEAIDGLVTRADQALYRAKRGGRNRVEDDAAS